MLEDIASHVHASKGSALCRLETSTLPYHKLSPSKHLLMRIVKIITPVTRLIPKHLTVMPLPEEGGLATIRLPGDGRVQTWANNVNGLDHGHPLRTMYK